MNFLQLVQKTWQESGLSGSVADVGSASGMQLHFVNWVRDAWIDIQRESDEWVFMKQSAIFATAAGQEEYQKGTIALQQLKKPLTAYILVNGMYQQLGLVVSPQSATELNRLNKQTSQPSVCYYRNSVFSFDTIPDKAYTVKVYFVRTEQELLLNTDIPIMDDNYHRAIVWKALEQYARYDEDNALFQSSRERADKALLSMRSDLTPPITFSRSAF